MAAAGRPRSQPRPVEMPEFGFCSDILQGRRECLVTGTRRFRYRNINSAAPGRQEIQT
ncbi:hypothetical protein [Paramagnetospirillum magneticum]|uniref:hypothetical protein n=1 Tax=Paramagnetospirillum magneticum TaxID=84159 RepID=UPI00130521B0|nr:hypothetical protein [Paramagnetospirillum magneticum]